MCISKLPKKFSLSWVPNSGEVMKLLRDIASSWSISVSSIDRILSLPFSLLSSSGSPKWSSNTLHITLTEFNLEVIFAQSASRF